MQSRFSHVWLFVTLWTIACHISLSMGFSRQEFWSGCHALLQEIFLTQELNPYLLSLLYWQANLPAKFDWRAKSSSWLCFFFCIYWSIGGFPGGASGKEPACRCTRHKQHGFDPGLGRSPGEGNGNPLQYSCLGNPMDRGAWWASVHGVSKDGHDWSDWAQHAQIAGLV